MESSFRPLTAWERAILERLLEPWFPGRDELRLQLAGVTARVILDDSTLELACEPGTPAPVRCTVPSEGECRDTDGFLIQILLHVRKGYLNELEILKLGPEPGAGILRLPEPRALELFTPYGECGVKWGG